MDTTGDNSEKKEKTVEIKNDTTQKERDNSNKSVSKDILNDKDIKNYSNEKPEKSQIEQENNKYTNENIQNIK